MLWRGRPLDQCFGNSSSFSEGKSGAGGGYYIFINHQQNNFILFEVIVDFIEEVC